jgi:hypothetical protein
MADPDIARSLVVLKCYGAPPPHIEDIRGRRYGLLLVIGFGDVKKPRRRTLWWFECDCGSRILLPRGDVVTGHTASCGCLQREVARQKMRKRHEKLRHNMSGTKLYNVYQCMMARCYRSTNNRWESYGGRGIMVCDEWKNDKRTFFEWSKANGYEEGLQLDRINNDGHYSPDNCRWVTSFVNMNNTRRNRYIEYLDQGLTITQWARKLGMSDAKFRHRLITRKWTMDRIVEEAASGLLKAA